MKTNRDLYRKLNEDILPFVQKPVRYLGLEMGTTVKDIKTIPLKFALAFPDFYELGMSHIGMGIIYDILNSKDYIACERLYLPYPDMNLKLKENKIPLFSLESFEEIKKFDIVGFSLQYELSYTNILLMLEMSNIPVFSKDRGIDDPFIGAGGPCAFNPLPLNDFMDFFIIGDGEITTVEVCDTILKAKNDLRNLNDLKDLNDLNDLKESKEGLIGTGDSIDFIDKDKYRDYVKAELAKIRGVYVPGFSKNVKKSILNDIDLSLIPGSAFAKGYIDNHIVPLIETIHNRLSVEIARGCSSGCRFCQAGYIYRPVRERKKETVINAVKDGLQNTGLEEISLSSLSTGDYSDIEALLSELSDLTSAEKVSMSFPSMRIGSLSENILQKTAAVKKTNFTLAPEAGTQRLRDIINKNISEDDLLEEAASLSKKGFKNLKLYFMIGLPFERISDLDGITALILKIKRIAKGLNITVNVNNFVPKPHTPFQWYPMEREPELNFKINYLKKSLRPLNITFRYQDPKVSFIEGLISRGDSFTSEIIYRAYKFGAIYDSESRLFNYGAWNNALNSYNANYNTNNANSKSGFTELTDRYLYGEKDPDALLPWDFIDILVDKEYLKNEFKKSYMQNLKYIYANKYDYKLYDDDNNDSDSDSGGAELLTENCRKVCDLCGVCDFKTISPVYSSKAQNIKMHKKHAAFPVKTEIENINITSPDSEVCPEKVQIQPPSQVSPKAQPQAPLQSFSELTVKYSKKGGIRYLGHLETVKILLKAFRIIKLPIIYKESRFSSRPKVSFSNPIPFMAESDDLYVKLRIKKEDKILSRLNNLKDEMNSFLPDGIKILEIQSDYKL